MRPQFYCLKYKGVMTPRTLMQDATRIGWKCRKYQNWKQIHVYDDDKEFLRRVGDSLVDQGRLDLSDFGRLSEIFLNVQRWRFDKENLLRDPPHKPDWESVEQLILLGDSSVALLKRQLCDFGLPESTNSEIAHAFLVVLAILKNGHEEGLVQADNDEIFASLDVDSTNAASVLEFVREYVIELYENLGLGAPRCEELYSLCAELCRDIGFSPYKRISGRSLEDVVTVEGVQNVVVRIGRLDSNKLWKVDLRKGAVVVSLNECHPYIATSLSDSLGTRQLGSLALAYGRATYDMFSAVDTIDEFTSYLGLALASPVREEDIANFESLVAARSVSGE